MFNDFQVKEEDNLKLKKNQASNVILVKAYIRNYYVHTEHV